MECLCIFLAVFLFAKSVTSKNLEITVNQESTIIEFPGSFNCTENLVDWEISVDEDGLGLSFIANETSLNPDVGEHLVLSSDSSMSGENASVTYLTGTLKDVWLAIPLTKKAFLRFSKTQENCSTNMAFTLTLKQYEPAVPLPPATTPNPYPPAGIKTDMLIYLAGKTLEQFEEEQFQALFKKTLQQAAFNFSKDNEIPYDSNKMYNETVFFKGAETCPRKYHDYKNCISVWLSVYVTQPRTDYELTVPHMEKFWSLIQLKGLPPELEVQPYKFPEVSTEILWWMLWLFIAVFITFALGYYFWRLERNSQEVEILMKEEEERKRKEDIFKHVELRKKQPQQLQLSKHQKIPEFMLSNGDVASVLSTPPTTKKTILKVANNVTDPMTTSVTPPSEAPSSPIGTYPGRFYEFQNIAYEDDEEYSQM